MVLEIKESTAKKLFALSRNHCARPECGTLLVIDNRINLGEMCHIQGEKPSSARYNSEMTDEQRRGISNLIILCNNCHTIIDTDEDTYSVQKLEQMKNVHESKSGDLFEIPANLLEKLMKFERLRVQQINQFGEGQQLVTQSGNINVQGWHPQDVISFFQVLIGGSFPKIEESQTKMKDNIENFAKTFVTIGLGKISEDKKDKFSDPDLRMTLEDAVRIASRKNNKDIHEILSNLIVHRIEHDDEIKQIVFNEAISSIGKLTVNQLKIISLNFMLIGVSWHTIHTLNDLEKFLNTQISKLIPFKDTKSEFGHIESISCGKISKLQRWSILTSIRNTFSEAFSKPFSEDEITNLEIEETIKQEIFEKSSDSTFRCKILNIHELEKFLEKKEDGKLASILRPFYTNHIDNENEIEIKLNNIPMGKTLIEACKGKNMENLFLTSVGEAIALTHLEIITDVKLDPNIWIN